MAIGTGSRTAPSHHRALDDAAIADLARRFRGALIRPGDAAYDAFIQDPALLAEVDGVAAFLRWRV